MALLIQFTENGAGIKLSLEKQRTTIGRDASNDISLDDELASKEHAVIEIISSEEHGIRLRSEEYENLYYNLLHKVGVTEKPYEGIFEIINLSRKLKDHEGEQFSNDIFEIYHSNIKTEMELALKEGRKLLDPTAMMNDAYTRYGKKRC